MKITKHDLEMIVIRINSITDSPEESYIRDNNGGLHAQVGNYHLDWAYGGVKLCRMVNENGGVTTIIDGYQTKRELYNSMQAFISGLTT